jgi:hypothetical protein
MHARIVGATDIRNVHESGAAGGCRGEVNLLDGTDTRVLVLETAVTYADAPDIIIMRGAA